MKNKFKIVILIGICILLNACATPITSVVEYNLPTADKINENFINNIDTTLDDLNISKEDKDYLKGLKGTKYNVGNFSLSTYSELHEGYELGSNRLIYDIFEEVFNIELDSSEYRDREFDDATRDEIENKIESGDLLMIPNLRETEDRNIIGNFTDILAYIPTYFYSNTYEFSDLIELPEADRKIAVFETGSKMDVTQIEEYKFIFEVFDKNDENSVRDMFTKMNSGEIKGFYGSIEQLLIKENYSFDPISSLLNGNVSKIFYTNKYKAENINTSILMNAFEVLFQQEKLGVAIQKYYNDIIQININIGNYFSDVEKKYIDDNKTIDIGMADSLFPESYIDEDGNRSGLAYNMLDRFKKISNLNFNTKYIDSDFTNSVDTVVNGDIDAYIGINITDEREKKVSFTDVFLEHEYYVVSDVSSPKIESVEYVNYYKLGYVEGFSYTDNDINTSRDNIKGYSNFDEMYEAFLSNEIDYFVASEYEYDMLYYGEKIYDLRKNVTLDGIAQMSIAVNNDLDDKETLINILNKIMNSLNLDLIKEKYIYEQDIDDISSREERLRSEYILYTGITVTLFIAIAIAYVYISKKRNEINKLKYDILTKAGTRTKLYEDFDQSNLLDYYMIFIDFDNLKNINSFGGHALGDKKLSQLVKNLKSIEFVEVFRIGGDEFIIMVKKCYYLNIENIKIKINSIIDGNDKNRISCSAAIIDIEKYASNNSIDEIIKYLDKALYNIKNSNKKGRLVACDAKVIDAVNLETHIENKIIESDLSQAISPVYHPIINLKDGIIVGFEALARIKIGDEVILPETLIPILKKNNKLVEADLFVFEKSIEMLSKLNNNSNKGCIYKSSSNFSANTIINVNIDDMLKIVDKYSVDINTIYIEINEESLLLSDTLNKIQKIKEAGFKIAIDDFTAGHSSIKQLLNLKLDVIKIDRDIINKSEYALNNSFKLLETFKHLGDLVDAQLVVEGVETKEQEEIVNKSNIKFVQGFLYSTPVECEELIKKVSEFKI